jgi:hypothetical protein
VGETSYGLPGLDLRPGDHVCAMYAGSAQRDEFLVPYLGSGLLAGEKCVCVLDESEPEATLAALRTMVDVDAALALHQLELSDATATYLTSGEFVTRDVIGFWDSHVNDALKRGQYASGRVAGEVPSILRERPGGLEAFMEYEMELYDYSRSHPELVLLCMYDLETFGGAAIVDMLRTHPRVLLGGLVLDNPHFIAPN